MFIKNVVESKSQNVVCGKYRGKYRVRQSKDL